MKKSFAEYSNPISIWILLLFPSLTSIYLNPHNGGIWQTDNFRFSMLIIAAFTETLLLGYIWAIFGLKLCIDESGISFRYLSWRFQSVHYDWSQIKSATIVEFDPKKDFSGWPVRSSNAYGKGYITRGKKGLLLELMNGEKMMMSVLDTEKALEALQTYAARPLIA
ncbi:hypothetical protein [Chitinophaga sp.]|uniref:hypothetical protein n=1 Tax=Chitinophaga sp. TaxID=1869181 RepID=UPI002F92D347